MHSDKVILRGVSLAAELLSVILLSGFVTSCGKGGLVSEKKYESLLEDYNTLKQTHETTKAEYISQAQEIDDILTKVSTISGQTSSLRLDVESGRASVTQAQQIESDLDALSKRLDDLEAAAAGNRQNKKLISSLRKVIEEKETEISSLKREIAEKDETIRTQGDRIAVQSDSLSLQSRTISSQEEKLRQKVHDQARMLYDAGIDFEEMADSAPEVSRSKNKSKVNSWTLSMYQKARLYYQRAVSAGYPDSEGRIEKVGQKIDSLEK